MQQKASSLKVSLFSSLACHLLIAAVLIYIHSTTPEQVLIGGDPVLKAIMINSWPQTTHSFAAKSDSNSKINQKQNKKTPSDANVITHARFKQKDKYAIEQPKQKMRSVDNSSRQTIPKTRSERMASVNLLNKVGTLGHDQNNMGETPSILHRRAPEYPRRALALRVEGKVIVRYDITPHGRVANVRIINAEPNAIFNRSVLQAMRFWQYRPSAAKDLTITIIFKRDKSVKFHG